MRTVPGRLARGGAYSSSTGVAAATDVPLLESMSRDRFVTLDEVPTDEVTLGVIGQFWKPAGGADAPSPTRPSFWRSTRLDTSSWRSTSEPPPHPADAR